MGQKEKHLEFIQGVINRMGSNSFILKGWSVTLVAALFALSAKELYLGFVYLSYFPAIAFWILDGYFLHQEKLFRELYNNVRLKKEEEIDFSMDNKPFKKKVASWLCVMFSTTLRIFHGVIIASIIIVMLIMLIVKKGI